MNLELTDTEYIRVNLVRVGGPMDPMLLASMIGFPSLTVIVILVIVVRNRRMQ